MIDLYYWPTPNGWKISIMLEECGFEYRTHPVNIGAGEQFSPDFLAISPNNRMPAIIDQAPSGGGEPISVFESGAILVYLAEKRGAMLGSDWRRRSAVLQWLMWQMSGVGPMFGQDGHFKIYAPERIPYAIDRYDRESRRLLRVLDTQLGKTGAWIAGGEYSIADIATFPWLVTMALRSIAITDFPAVQTWFEAMADRPAVQQGLTHLEHLRTTAARDDAAARAVLFGIEQQVETQAPADR